MGLISRVLSRTYRNLFIVSNFLHLSKWPNEPRKSESSVNTEPDTVLPSESSSSEWRSASTSDTPTHTLVVIRSNDTPSASGNVKNPESRSLEVLTYQKLLPLKPLNTVSSDSEMLKPSKLISIITSFALKTFLFVYKSSIFENLRI